jgi:hypothetical protein
MNGWEYRILQRDGELFLIEVYYDENGICAWTNTPTEPCGNTISELAHDLELMEGALALPVLIEVGAGYDAKLVNVGQEETDG